MLIDEYAKQLAEELELPEGIPLEEDGAYALTRAPQITVKMRPLEKGALFWSHVGEVPQRTTNEALFQILMLGNLLGQGTGGSLLSLDESGTQVVLSKELPQQLTYMEFRDTLEDFFNYADYWKKKVAQS